MTKGRLVSSKKKDDPEIIINQLGKYQMEGYPAHNGLLACSVIFRKKCICGTKALHFLVGGDCIG